MILKKENKIVLDPNVLLYMAFDIHTIVYNFFQDYILHLTNFTAYIRFALFTAEKVAANKPANKIWSPKKNYFTILLIAVESTF